MIHFRKLKFRALIKPNAGLVASAIDRAVFIRSQSSHADIQALTAAYAPMQPFIQTEPALPKPRPDPALAYDLQPVDITLPRAKPALKNILPISTEHWLNDQSANRARYRQRDSICSRWRGRWRDFDAGWLSRS